MSNLDPGDFCGPEPGVVGPPRPPLRVGVDFGVRGPRARFGGVLTDFVTLLLLLLLPSAFFRLLRGVEGEAAAAPAPAPAAFLGFGDAAFDDAALPAARFSFRFADFAFAGALPVGVASAAATAAAAAALKIASPPTEDKVGAGGVLPFAAPAMGRNSGTAAGGSVLCASAAAEASVVVAPCRHGCEGDGIEPTVRAAIPPNTDPSNNAPGISSAAAGAGLFDVLGICPRSCVRETLSVAFVPVFSSALLSPRFVFNNFSSPFL